MRLYDLIAWEARRHRRATGWAAALAAIVGGASVLLLGLSGWFITAASLAGVGGAASALAFNYMLPSATIRLLAIARTGARYGEAVFAHDAALRTGARLRPALFGAIATAPVRAALTFTQGASARLLVDDVARIETALVRRSAGWSAIGAIVAGVCMTALAGLDAALALLVIDLALAAGTIRLARMLAQRERARDAATETLRAVTHAMLAAAPELRCYRPEAAARLLDPPTRAAASVQRRLSRIQPLPAWLQSVCMTTAATVTLVLARDDGAALAALAALAAAISVDGLAPWLRAIAERGGDADAAMRLDGVLRGARSRETLAVMTGAPPLEILGTRLLPGERIALRGASGAGKTTLVERALGLRPATAGQLKIAGVDAVFLPAEQLRATFAWQPQDAAVLAGTVRDNLLLGRPSACETALWHALHDAALDDVVRALPQGLDSWIGDAGTRLSGGERQRLALARALLSPAPWLLLDEPVEALDPETRVRVCRRLAQRLNRTSQGAIIVSHQPIEPGLVSGEIQIGTAAADFEDCNWS